MVSFGTDDVELVVPRWTVAQVEEVVEQRRQGWLP